MFVALAIGNYLHRGIVRVDYQLALAASFDPLQNHARNVHRCANGKGERLPRRLNVGPGCTRLNCSESDCFYFWFSHKSAIAIRFAILNMRRLLILKINLFLPFRDCFIIDSITDVLETAKTVKQFPTRQAFCLNSRRAVRKLIRLIY